jgi:hypothetical protein
MPQPNAQNATVTAAEFLTRCFAPGETIALFLRREVPRATIQRIVQLETALAPRYLAWLAHENFAGANVYVAANPLRSNSRKRIKECIASVRHLYLDLDTDGDTRLSSLRASEAVPLAEPLLMREDRWVSRHCSSRKWPQIDEAHGLNPLRADLIKITDTVRLGLHLTVKFRQPLCPIALIRIQLPVFLFIEQVKLIDPVALRHSLDEMLLLRLKNLTHRLGFDLRTLLQLGDGIARILCAAGLQMRKKISHVMRSAVLELTQDNIRNRLSVLLDKRRIQQRHCFRLGFLSGNPPQIFLRSSFSRRTITSSSIFLGTFIPRKNRCGSRSSSSAVKLLECPL